MLPFAVQAQSVDIPWIGPLNTPPPLQGLYMGAGAGANFLQDERFIGATGTATDARFRSRTGWVGAVSLGYAFGNGLRTEIEGSYRSNRISQGRDFGFPAAAGGFENKYGPMFNVLYDLTGIIPIPFAPYAGVGVGYQWVQLENLKAYNNAGGYPTIQSDSTTGGLAYQAILGLAFELPQWRGFAFTTEYRFMGVAHRKYDFAVATAPGVSSSPRAKLGNNFNHSAMLGVRYAFNSPPPPAPAPAPMPAAAPVPSRSYLVFFDWDKSTLTDRARQIIGEAAQASTKVQTTRIEVNGYTDTSGTVRHNEGLSLRRARAVMGELVRQGVPESAIVVRGLGSTNLLVATGPNVREPQNRRVEIILR